MVLQFGDFVPGIYGLPHRVAGLGAAPGKADKLLLKNLRTLINVLIDAVFID